MTTVSLERTEGSGMADGGVTLDIPTNAIPRHLRHIGSRFVVVTTTFRPEVGDSVEQVREAGHPTFSIEELHEHDA